MKVKTLVSSLMLLTASSVMAQSYQFEVGANITHYDPDNAGSDSSLGVYGIYHFAPVSTTNLPLAEAAFLRKSSNAYVRGHQDLDVIHAGVEYYIPNSMFYVAAELQRVDVAGYRNNDWGVRFGLTPVTGLLVWTSYYDEPGYDANIHAKYVMDLGYSNALNIEAGHTDGDHYDSTYLYGDFYFNHTFSVGAGYQDEFDNDVFTLRTRKFFNDQFSGELAVSKADDGKGFSVGASMRF